MNFARIIRSTLCVLSCLYVFTSSASADVSYTLSGSLGDTITFSIPQLPIALSPSPPASDCYLDDYCFSVNPVAVTLDGTLYPNATVSFYTPADGGGLTILAGGLGSAVLVNNDGPGYEQLFSGTLTNPVLENFTNLQLLQVGSFSPEYNEAFLLNGTVSSATPEPESLVLLGTGVLGILGVVRRRMLRS